MEIGINRYFVKIFVIDRIIGRRKVLFEEVQANREGGYSCEFVRFVAFLYLF